MRRRHKRFFVSQLLLSAVSLAVFGYFFFVTGILSNEEAEVSSTVSQFDQTQQKSQHPHSHPRKKMLDMEEEVLGSPEIPMGPKNIRNLLQNIAKEQIVGQTDPKLSNNTYEWLSSLPAEEAQLIIGHLKNTPVEEWAQTLSDMQKQPQLRKKIKRRRYRLRRGTSATDNTKCEYASDCA